LRQNCGETSIVFSLHRPRHHRSSALSRENVPSSRPPLPSRSDRILSPVRTRDRQGRLGWYLGSRDVPGAAGLFFVTDNPILDYQVLMTGLRTTEALHLEGAQDSVTIEMRTAVGGEAPEPQIDGFEVFVTRG
jgi:hypothetical protein